MLQKTADGTAYLNPASVYGAERADGTLRRTAARGSAPETIESFYPITFDDVLIAMRSERPPALMAFDGVNHHSPFLRNERAMTEASAEGEQPVAAEEEMAASGAARSMPAGWVAPEQVGATGRESDEVRALP